MGSPALKLFPPPAPRPTPRAGARGRLRMESSEGGRTTPANPRPGPAPSAAEPRELRDGEKHLVLLRDGRTLIGFLRSIDQFANLVLHQTVERIHVGKKYGDIPRGIFVVRGENVVLLGEIDLEKESDTPLQQVSIEEILEEQRVEQQTKLEAEKLKVQALKDRGLSIPRADTLDEY
nr:U6 snRNA-associated Sm-like protein LSm1 isoform X1 [Macaca fascicularis]